MRLLSAVNQGYAVPMTLEEKCERLRTDPAWTTIWLPVPDADGAVEEVLVEKISEGTYRIASSPGMIRGLAADDLISLDPSSEAGYRMVRRGDNVCVHVYCELGRRDEVRAALERTLGHVGGRLDGTMGETGLCFTVPVLAGFTRIEDALGRVVGDGWEYSNVFDEWTGEPLNWWLHDGDRTR
jgi:hypothetical protein